jgi:hypothetical protein
MCIIVRILFPPGKTVIEGCQQIRFIRRRVLVAGSRCFFLCFDTEFSDTPALQTAEYGW